MSKAEELAKQLYPDPRMEDYDDILVYRADRDNASMGRINVVRVYEQAEKDLALTAGDIGKIFNKVKSEAVKWTATEACYPDVAKWFNEYKKAKK